MNNKAIIIVVILVLLGLGAYAYTQREAKAPGEVNNQTQSQETDNTAQTPVPTPTPTPSPTPPGQNTKPTEGTFSNGEEGMAPDILVTEVSYDGKAFSPSTVNIKVGDIVIFKNNSDSPFWPASGPHPTHTNYPEFDAKQAIAPGGKYQFKFEKEGSWKYHDHYNPTAFGTINVSK